MRAPVGPNMFVVSRTKARCRLGHGLRELDLDGDEADFAAHRLAPDQQVEGCVVGRKGRVAAVGSVFFTVLGQQTGAGAYGNAFASALAVAAVLQVLGMLLATKMNHRRRAQAEIAPPADVIQSSE